MMPEVGTTFIWYPAETDLLMEAERWPLSYPILSSFPSHLRFRRKWQVWQIIHKHEWEREREKQENWILANFRDRQGLLFRHCIDIVLNDTPGNTKIHVHTVLEKETMVISKICHNRALCFSIYCAVFVLFRWCLLTVNLDEMRMRTEAIFYIQTLQCDFF